MAILKQNVNGKIIKKLGIAGLLLDQSGDEIELAYGLTIQEGEREIFPESLLDDWGHEIRTLFLYEWIQENGTYFPRAEIFGRDRSGRPVQCFLRELDLTLKYACYTSQTKPFEVTTALPLRLVALADETIVEPVPINRPPDVATPLKYAQVMWWKIAPTHWPLLGYELLDDLVDS